MLAASLTPMVGARSDSKDAPFITECAGEALDLIERYTIGEHIPERAFKRACLEVAADLYHRRTARNGIAGFDTGDMGASPVRINRDPLASARPILAPFMRVGIA